MKHHVTDDPRKRSELKRLIDAKQANEQKLGEDLACEFNENMAVMGCLRGLVANAMKISGG